MKKMKWKSLLLLFSAVTLMQVTPVEIAFADRGKALKSVNKAGSPKLNQYNKQRRDVRGRGRSADNNRVVAGNTVVVNRNTDRGYGNPCCYNDWDDDDPDLLEAFGTAAAVTAGVTLTAGVVGQIFEDEPDDCQQQMVQGTTYLVCNGVWYQPVMMGSNVNYQVITPPAAAPPPQ